MGWQMCFKTYSKLDRVVGASDVVALAQLLVGKKDVLELEELHNCVCPVRPIIAGDIQNALDYFQLRCFKYSNSYVPTRIPTQGPHLIFWIVSKMILVFSVTTSVK